MIDYPLRPVQEADELAAEVRRVAGALIDDAIEVTSKGRAADADARVHAARKRLKEVRSLLRLVRKTLVDEAGDEIRGRENDACKSAANQLGDARDAAVMVQTLDKLKRRFSPKNSPPTPSRVCAKRSSRDTSR